MANIAILVFFCLFSSPARAQEGREQMKKYYDTAFQYYIDGKYAKAIEYWNMVLKIDPAQITAKNMVQQAREKMSGEWGKLEKEFYALMSKGQYYDALILNERLLALDDTNPVFLKLKKRLEGITGIVKDASGRKKKPWRIAILGLYNYANKNENLPLAYDALRYAVELSPKNEYFRALLLLVEKESPALKTKDSKIPETGLIEYKKDLSLQYIYNSQFYQALKELETVLQLEPEDIVALKRLGSVYLKLKKYSQARKTWEKALKLSPDDAQLREYIKALDSMKDSSRTGQ